jgi:hypothetical protein
MDVYTDGIWVSEPREIAIVKQLSEHLCGFATPTVQDQNNFGYPYAYKFKDYNIHCRIVDSVFQPTPDAWTDPNAIIVTDNYPLKPVAGKLRSLLPEIWSIWRFDPVYTDSETEGYNCFMNRLRGDRSEVFYELIRRNILGKGAVSYNVTADELEQQYQSAELFRYSDEHDTAMNLVPYNVVNVFGSLEQVIMLTNISLVLETYMSEDHIVFSEKIFRALQMPRPWLLFCSPYSIKLLKSHGFDVLDDYVDHRYDSIENKTKRMDALLNQLATFTTRKYTRRDLERFEQACTNNKQLLDQWTMDLPLLIEEVELELAHPDIDWDSDL